MRLTSERSSSDPSKARRCKSAGFLPSRNDTTSDKLERVLRACDILLLMDDLCGCFTSSLASYPRPAASFTRGLALRCPPLLSRPVLVVLPWSVLPLPPPLALSLSSISLAPRVHCRRPVRSVASWRLMYPSGQTPIAGKCIGPPTALRSRRIFESTQGPERRLHGDLLETGLRCC